MKHSAGTRMKCDYRMKLQNNIVVPRLTRGHGALLRQQDRARGRGGGGPGGRASGGQILHRHHLPSLLRCVSCGNGII